MNVPFFDMKRHIAQIRQEVTEAIDRVIDSGSFINGKWVEGFESAFARTIGVKYAVGVSSGTDALLSILMALDLKPGFKVITTPFTFIATADVIVRAGGRPIFVDVDPDTYLIDEEQVRAMIGPDANVVMPVHLFGQIAPTDFGPDVLVIEDAAQAVMAKNQQGMAGSQGVAAGFSFFPAKNLGAFGDGGAVTTNDEKLYRKIRMLRAHGSEKKYIHNTIGGNFRLDALQAAILNVQLKYINEWTKKRRENARTYNQWFTEMGLIDNGFVRPPKEAEGAYHVYHQYVIRVKRRDELRGFLKTKGIATAVYYPVPLHLQPCFEFLGYKKGAFKTAEQLSTEVLALPVFPELKREEQEYVVEQIAMFFKKGR